MSQFLDASARGVYPISVTPFLDDGAIDYPGMDRLVEFFIECGVPGFTLLGVLGEGNKLGADEALALLSHVMRRVNRRCKVMVGVSQVGLDGFARFTASARDLGAGAILVAPAAGLKTEDQILAYYEAIAGKIGPDMPIAMQDFPQNTGVFMSPETVGRVLERVPNIVIVKHEESPGLRKVTKLRAQESAGRRRVSMLVGNSALHLPQELQRGVDGANTGVAFPEMLIEVCNRHFAGNPDGAEDLYDIFLPVIRHEWQMGPGLAIRKEIFRRRGLIATAKTRAPGPSLDADDQRELTSLLARLVRKLEDAGEAGLIRSYREF